MMILYRYWNYVKQKLLKDISALSIANIIYVMRKELNNEKIQDIVLTISSILTIVDLSKNDIYNATLLNFNV